jgi:hypothetical protein
MIQKITRTANLISNMGFRYLFFRISYLIKSKLGWHRRIFPAQPEFKKHITLNEWKENIPPFFFCGKKIENFPRHKKEILKTNFHEIKKGNFTFFNKSKINLGKDYNWRTNPITNYEYDISKHWSEIQDFSEEAGDIKFVWEKSRFSFLNEIVRYDYHFDDDQSEFVFSEIEDFIDKNPINLGPNYKCSQEISLRVLNWTFALNYYRDSPNLTEELFDKIMHVIYWQIHHVYHNINFSRIAVRNNHAITETLMLYLSDKLFPFFPDVKNWAFKGKNWFEDEVKYQIYNDGTFIQFSMNYHRVVVQLLTYAICISKLNNDSFKEFVYERAYKSLDFLYQCLQLESGFLPNYGANDGALFFNYTISDYRDFRPQLNGLHYALTGKHLFLESQIQEETNWFCSRINNNNNNFEKIKHTIGIKSFPLGGYYLIRDKRSFTFIRCGSHKDRPSQADNLHVDVWVDGVNVLGDSGSYKYNTSKEELDFFIGTKAHNTVTLNNENQMLKGKRFIWYFWTQRKFAHIDLIGENYLFIGEIKAFSFINKKIRHKRTVKKIKGVLKWVIIDEIINKPKNMIVSQLWNGNDDFYNEYEVTSQDCNSENISPNYRESWRSDYYGIKNEKVQLLFNSNLNKITTEIVIKN